MIGINPADKVGPSETDRCNDLSVERDRALLRPFNQPFVWSPIEIREPLPFAQLYSKGIAKYVID
jgi:hypothetical protein